MTSLNTEAIWEAPEVASARVVASEDDMAAVARLRYEVYIAEQGKPYAKANHETRMWSDELDKESAIVMVSCGGECVGTVRACWFSDPLVVARYHDVFPQSDYPDVLPQHICVCSRLAVRPEERNTAVRNLLFCSIFDLGVARGTRICFATCAAPLLRVFRKYGFREVAPPYVDVDVGLLHRLALDIEDRAYLASIKSPFLEARPER